MVHTEAIFSVYEHVMRSGGGFLLDEGRFREPIYSGDLEMLGDLELSMNLISLSFLPLYL